jgi:enoyl-CoA hydratase/carnithine racemase
MPLLRRDDTDGVATLTMTAPDGMNLLSDAMLAELQAAFDAIGTDKTIRVVVLAAKGRAFCAGHDLGEMQAARAADDGGTAAHADLFARCSQVMLTIAALPQPVIAQVQGVAVAAGCQLVASCDLAVAADTARFGVNGIDLGLFCSTPMVALTRAIPPKAAFEMLTTGRLIDAAEAVTLGLVNRAVPPDTLTEATETLAAQIAAKQASAITLGKRAFHAQRGLAPEAAYALTAPVITCNLALPETDARITAFLDRKARSAR